MVLDMAFISILGLWSGAGAVGIKFMCLELWVKARDIAMLVFRSEVCATRFSGLGLRLGLSPGFLGQGIEAWALMHGV